MSGEVDTLENVEPEIPELKNWIIYDPATGHVNCEFRGREEDAALQEGEYMLQTGEFDANTQYVNPATLQLIDRPILNVTTTIDPPSVFLNGLVPGTLVACGHNFVTVEDDEELELEFDVGGDHRIIVEPPAPYQFMEWTVTVNV